jgi:hypothetical protein
MVAPGGEHAFPDGPTAGSCGASGGSRQAFAMSWILQCFPSGGSGDRARNWSVEAGGTGEREQAFSRVL